MVSTFTAVDVLAKPTSLIGDHGTTIANITAVTKLYGPEPLAFIIFSIVAALFFDITHSFVIRFSLTF